MRRPPCERRFRANEKRPSRSKMAWSVLFGIEARREGVILPFMLLRILKLLPISFAMMLLVSGPVFAKSPYKTTGHKANQGAANNIKAAHRPQGRAVKAAPKGHAAKSAVKPAKPKAKAPAKRAAVKPKAGAKPTKKY